MPTDNAESSDHVRSLPPALIRLARNDRGALIVAGVQAPDRLVPFQSFPYPRLPLSLHCWLTGLGAEFRRRYDRCIAALLVLDRHEGRWIQPVIPSQSCGHDGSAWTLDLGGQQLPAHHLVGGSFQMRLARDVMEAVETVPKFDGLHIVQTLQGQRSFAYCFLHVQGETGVLPVEQAIEDDWKAALTEAAPRMTIE